jgi:glycosyltransferase involved in cell wall biosynthesis
VKSDKRVVFIVVGRLGKNLIVSKVLPFIELNYFKRIIVFSEDPGIEIKSIEYICLPKYIQKCRVKILKNIFRIIYEPGQLIYFALKLKPEYINGVYTNPKGINSFIASTLSGSRCITSVIGGQPEIETSFYIKGFSVLLNMFFLKRCYKIFTKGHKDNEFLLNKGVDPNKLVIFNGAVDIKRYFYKNEIKDIDLIYVGYFDENKGPDRFIDICRKIFKEKNRLNAYMLGSGPLFQVMVKYIEKINLKSCIKMTGAVTDVEYYLKRAKIFILPSKSEGLSTAMLEAMSCGCVPVLSDVGNNGEAALHGINSFLVKNYNDIEEYSLHISRLLADNDLWQRISHCAIKTINEKYSPGAQSKALEKIFN